MVEIRAAREDDAAELRAIEQRAGEQFRTVGLDAVADDEPPSLAELVASARLGRSWVATDGSGETIGYVIVGTVDGAAFIDQVSVTPDHQGEGVGRALVERVRDWAAQTKRSWVVLTTFDDVPWNRPLYEHLGFVVMADDEAGPELRALQRAESAQPWGVANRVSMRLAAGPDDDSSTGRPPTPSR